MCSRTTALAALLLAAICARAAAESKTLKLDKPIKSAAIDPASGEMAVIFPDDDRVLLFAHLSDDLSAANPIERAVGKGAAKVIFKHIKDRSYFLALCPGDHSLYVLEARTLEVLKQFALTGENAALAAPLDESVPFAYYSSGVRIGRIDLATLTDQGLAIEGRVSLPDVPMTDLYVSHDGRMIYEVRSPDGGVPWLWIMQIAADAEKPHIRELEGSGSIHVSNIAVDPMGDGAVINRFRDYGAKPSSYEVNADMHMQHTCFMTSRPIFFDFNDNKLVAYSYNTRKELASLAIDPAEGDEDAPPPPMRPFRRFQNSPPPVQVLCDEKNEKLLICRADRVVVAPLADMQLPREPLLNVTVKGPRTLAPNKEAVFSVTRATADSSVELVKPPIGMTFTGDSLHWTPTDADVGLFTVHVRVFAGDLERALSFVLHVERPNVELGFSPDAVALSADGKLAVACTTLRAAFRNVGVVAPPPEQGSRIALVDLEKGKVIAQRDLLKPIHFPVIVDDHVFAAGVGSGLIYRYSAKDLSDEAKAFQDGDIYRLSVAGHHLFAEINGRGTIEVSPTSLKPIADAEPSTTGPYQQRWAPIPCADGWLWHGSIYDQGCDKILHVVNPEIFPNIQLKYSTGLRPTFHPPADNVQAPWGCIINGTRVERWPSHTTVGVVPSNDSAILFSLPAVVSLVSTPTPPAPAPATGSRIVLQVSDLVNVASQTQLTLKATSDGNMNGNMMGVHRFAETPGHLLVVLGSSLFPVDLANLKRENLAEAPVIVPINCPIVADDNPLSFTLTARGMTGTVEFALEEDDPGATIEAATGKVTIDSAALRARAVEALLPWRGGRTPNNPMVATAAGTPAEQAVATLHKDLGKRYTQLFGVEPKGIPTAFPLHVIARDDAQHKATLDLKVLVLVDPAVVIAKWSPNSETSNPATSPGDVIMLRRQEYMDLRQQLEDLKKQNTEMTAQLKLLKELVAPPTTKP